MKYDLTYRQTPSERYRSGMNEEVEEFVDAYPGIRLISHSGGSMVDDTNQDDMIADNTFTVEGRQADVRALASAIQRQIGRTVEIDIL